MKRSVVVTLADIKFVNQAKQLFGSIYENSGWKGDYLLLSHNIPENKLTWFRKRNIIVWKCKPLTKTKVGIYPPCLLSKLYLFKPDFKKWKSIIYLDADIIVRASLDRLTKMDGFNVAPEIIGEPLSKQFKIITTRSPKRAQALINHIHQKYDCTKLSFNAGVIVLNTDIINKYTFSELLKLYKLYGKVSLYGDQGIQNLYFYNKWKKLPRIYNLYPEHFHNRFNIKPEKIQGIILHFVGISKNVKPWMPKNYFYKEWKRNLTKSEKMNARFVKNSGIVWSGFKIFIYSIYLGIKSLTLR